VVVGDGPDLALLVPDDRSDRIRLDEQLVLEALGLIHRRQRGGLVRVPDRDQVRHPYLLPLLVGSPASWGRRGSAPTA
jgi:hypothetical protein